MKVYISADMEGLATTSEWCEVSKGKDNYELCREQMTAEVCAACEGALAAGATEIVVKDAHSTARNIIAGGLPKEASLIRGWSRHPYFMMQGLDRSFDAAMMIGYHAAAGFGGNPLAHTISSAKIASIRVNDEEYASEFWINALTAALEAVPVVMLSGDRDLCDSAQSLVPGITTVAVKDGAGASTTSIHPAVAVEHIRAGAEQALKKPFAVTPLPLPATFQVEFNYFNNRDAYKASFYPGASLSAPRSVLIETSDWFEILRMIIFVL